MALNEELKQQNQSLTRLVERLSEGPVKLDSYVHGEVNNNRSTPIDQMAANKQDKRCRDNSLSEVDVMPTVIEASWDAEEPKSLYSSSHLLSSRYKSHSGADGCDRRGSGSSRSSSESHDRWSSRAASTYGDYTSSSSSRKRPSTSKFSSSSSSPDLTGYSTIPPSSRSHTTRTSSDPSTRSYTSRANDHVYSTESKYLSANTSYRSRAPLEPTSLSKARVPFSFSSSGSKRVGKLLDSYRKVGK